MGWVMKKNNAKKYVFSKIVLLVLLSLSLGIITTQTISLVKENNQYDDFVLTNYSGRIKSTVESSINILHVLETIVMSLEGNVSQKDFNEVCEAMLSEIVTSASFVPGGVVEYVYPYEEHKNYIGHNDLKDPLTADDASLAIKQNDIVFSGPYDFVSEKTNIIARNPVFLETENGFDFWGFVTITLDISTLMDSVSISSIEDLGYKFSIQSLYRNSKIVILQSENYDASLQKQKEVKFGNNSWAIGVYNETQTQYIVISMLILTSFLGLLSFFIYSSAKRIEERQNEMKLQLDIDPLTKVYNRRMFDFYSQTFITSLETNGVTLLYLDLNDFKPVNDFYGHEIGDKLLVLFTKRLRENLKKDDLIIRMGGDEFAIIINESLSKSDIGIIINRLKCVGKEPYSIEDYSLQISVSIGHAVYPTEGSSLRELLIIADQKMYFDKNGK